jgi:hypothetical protein
MGEVLAQVTATSRQSLALALRELVAALDQRAPQLQRAGEVAIARDALALRAEALARLTEIEQS